MDKTLFIHGFFIYKGLISRLNMEGISYDSNRNEKYRKILWSYKGSI